jgi:hypothetical protein
MYTSCDLVFAFSRMVVCDVQALFEAQACNATTFNTCQQPAACLVNNGVLACPNGELNGVRDGDETGVDCGGPAEAELCERCGAGQGCGSSADCQPGLDCNANTGTCIGASARSLWLSCAGREGWLLKWGGLW